MGGKSLFYRVVNSPLGLISLVADENCLLRADFVNSDEYRIEGQDKLVLSERLPVLELAAQELQSYFNGTLREFSVPYRLEGTPFRLRVWSELCRIPYGQTISYGTLASRIGNPKACRAVGQANHYNPIGIIVPCHRVIGHDGRLVGYGSGLDKKKWLLDFEQSQLGR